MFQTGICFKEELRIPCSMDAELFFALDGHFAQDKQRAISANQNAYSSPSRVADVADERSTCGGKRRTKLMRCDDPRQYFGRSLRRRAPQTSIPKRNYLVRVARFFGKRSNSICRAEDQHRRAGRVRHSRPTDYHGGLESRARRSRVPARCHRSLYCVSYPRERKV